MPALMTTAMPVMMKIVMPALMVAAMWFVMFTRYSHPFQTDSPTDKPIRDNLFDTFNLLPVYSILIHF
jgi:hypothetical protein